MEKGKPGARKAIAALCVAVGAAAVAAVARAADGEAVPLAWRWVEGDEIRYRLVQEHRQAFFGPEGQVGPEVGRTQTIVFRQEVTGVSPEGVASIAATYESVAVRTDEGPGGEAQPIEYDSTDPAGAAKARHPAIRPVAMLVGRTVRYKVAPSGTVSDVSGFDEIVEKAIEGMARQDAEKIRASTGNDVLAKQIEDQFRVVPGRPAKPGDSWEVDVEQPVPGLGRLKVEHRYALAAVEPAGEGRRARISVESALSTARAAEPPAPGGLVMRLKDGRGSGEILFDPERGRLTRREIALSITLELERRLPGAAPPTGTAERGPTFEQRSRQRSTLELVE